MNYESWRISFQDSEQAARAAFEAWRAAEEKGITLNALELMEAAYWANPDGDQDQEETEVHIGWLPERVSVEGEKMESGFYLYYIDCPEEGVIGPLGQDPVPDAVKLTGGSTSDECFELMGSLASALYAAVHAGKLSEADRIKSDDGTVEIAELLDRANAMLATQQPTEQETCRCFKTNDEAVADGCRCYDCPNVFKEESNPEIPVNEESLIRDAKPGCHAGHDCPLCKGKGGSNCHINNGLDSSQHSWEWVACDMCQGKGSIEPARYHKWIEGRKLQQERISRGETLGEMAERTGKTPAQISAEEWGRNDGATGEKY